MANPRDSIIVLPNEHLRQGSKKVSNVNASVKKIVTDMQAALLDWEKTRDHEVGVALAAVQINEHVRVVIVRRNPDDKTDNHFGIFINPEITKYEGPIAEDYEGCLSVPDIYGKVPRYTKVRIKALDLNGKTIRLTAKDFLARVLQHEIDHTKGKLFIDHIKKKPDAFYKLLGNGELEKLNYETDVKNNHILW